MTSFIRSSFIRNLIGNTKVLVSDQPVRTLDLAMNIAQHNSLKKNDEAFLITNLDDVYARFKLWKRELPMIEPFYAVKCNPDEAILRLLASLGVGFDCASKAEIDMVTRMGVSPDRIIYAHPSKSSTFIEHANANGVRMMTFDSAEEVKKITMQHKNPQLVLRIAVSDPTATYPLYKFGADPISVSTDLLTHAAELGTSVVGVSFHVGSGCNDPSAFRVALMHAKNLTDFGRKLGHRMDIVDIGGGFPGGDHRPSFEQMASIIRSAIDEYFPNNDVRLIAEPGRFFVDSPCALVVNVVARKAVVETNSAGEPSTHMHYYVNDGVFGSFMCCAFEDEPKCGRPLFNRKGESFPSTIWGPTCDSTDRIESNKMMRALDAGEWLIYEDMGAYSSAIATSFNGFPRPAPIHVVSARVWEILGLEGHNNNIRDRREAGERECYSEREDDEREKEGNEREIVAIATRSS